MANPKRVKANFRTRMAPEARRAQLLEVASHLLFERGVEAVRIPEIAALAGVTRPVVYRFFPNRQAVFAELLEELDASIDRHLASLSLRTSEDLDLLVSLYVFAICDAIEECGPGAWVLLGGAALDEELHAVVRDVEARLTRPWMERVARLLPHMEYEDVAAVTGILVAGSRAVLRSWITGSLPRTSAAALLSRTVRAILREFSKPVPNDGAT